MIPIDIIKVILPSVLAFSVGMILTPFLTNFLYKHKLWKKKAGKTTIDGKVAEVFNKLHLKKETGTPRMGGIIIWASAFVTVAFLWLLSRVLPGDLTLKLEFVSRTQTWIPLTTLLVGGLVGLIDDYFEVKEGNGGLSLKKRLLVVGFLALAIGAWFYFKLDVTGVGIPGIGELYLGLLIIPFFLCVTWGIYAGGIIDGIDGLSGGVFAITFAGYAVIAFSQGQINLAAFCATLVGAILAFLWFNVPPARFYMTETGSMALTVALAVVAFMTDSIAGGVGIFVLPIIALPLVLTVLSVLIQLTSKKLRGKKIFQSTPLHHHFEAIGWSREKITMRYWIVSSIVMVFGVIIALVG